MFDKRVIVPSGVNISSSNISPIFTSFWANLSCHMYRADSYGSKLDEVNTIIFILFVIALDS